MIRTAEGGPQAHRQPNTVDANGLLPIPVVVYLARTDEMQRRDQQRFWSEIGGQPPSVHGRAFIRTEEEWNGRGWGDPDSLTFNFTRAADLLSQI